VNIYSTIHLFTALQALNTKLTAKDSVLDINRELQNQMQATIDGLTVTKEANNRTINDLRNTEVSNKRMLQELREEQKQLQATNDGLIKTAETMKRTAQLLCAQSVEVSTHEVEAITSSKWAEIPPAINIASFFPNNVGL
jgi:conjugal transfer/entry exclusion protein